MASTHGQVVGALPPPRGMTPNFQNPESIWPAIRVVNIFLVLLITITLSVRLYTKCFVIKERSFADYSSILSYVSFIVMVSLGAKAAQYGAGIHQWNVPLTDMTSFAYWAWISEMLSLIGIGSARLTLCLQFKQILVVGRGTRFWMIVVFMYVLVSYYFAQLLFTIFQCTPVAKVYDPEMDGFCLSAQYQRFIIATGAFDLFGDMLMIAFPLYAIWSLHISTRRRLAIGSLFGVGVLALIASILRLIFSISNYHSLDVTYTLSQVAECTLGEICAGIIIANLVCFPAFFYAMSETLKSWTTVRQSAQRSTVSYTDPAVAGVTEQETKTCQTVEPSISSSNS